MLTSEVENYLNAYFENPTVPRYKGIFLNLQNLSPVQAVTEIEALLAHCNQEKYNDSQLRSHSSRTLLHLLTQSKDLTLENGIQVSANELTTYIQKRLKSLLQDILKTLRYPLASDNRALCCPVMQQVFFKPMLIFPSGYTLEADALIEILKSSGLCPITKLPIQSYVMNRAIAEQVELHLLRYPSQKSQQYQPLDPSAVIPPIEPTIRPSLPLATNLIEYSNLFVPQPRSQKPLLFPAAVIVTGKKRLCSNVTRTSQVTDVYIIGPREVEKKDLMGHLASLLTETRPRRLPVYGCDFLFVSARRETGRLVPQYGTGTASEVAEFAIWPTLDHSVEQAEPPHYVKIFRKDRFLKEAGIMLIVSSNLEQVRAVARMAREFNGPATRSLVVQFDETNRLLTLEPISDETEIIAASQDYSQRSVADLKNYGWQMLQQADVINDELIRQSEPGLTVIPRH